MFIFNFTEVLHFLCFSNDALSIAMIAYSSQTLIPTYMYSENYINKLHSYFNYYLLFYLFLIDYIYLQHIEQTTRPVTIIFVSLHMNSQTVFTWLLFFRTSKFLTCCLSQYGIWIICKGCPKTYLLSCLSFLFLSIIYYCAINKYRYVFLLKYVNIF